MTNNDVAFKIMGYYPTGYVVVCELHFTGAKYRTGMVYVDGIPVCGFNMKEVF